MGGTGMYEELEKTLDTYVRPLLRTHGGDMQVVDFTDGVVKFKLHGHCAGCPAADFTTENLIQTELMAHLPEVKRAVLIQEVSQSLLDEARSILKQRHGG
ncbi:NifU family protein [Treponema vincentii]|jgi:nitrogen-fixing nifU domain protein|nr:NifU family protein [Treponema vincentii]